MNPRTTSAAKQPKSEENLDYDFSFEGEPFKTHSDRPGYGRGGKNTPASGRPCGWNYSSAFENGLSNRSLTATGYLLLKIILSFNSQGRQCFASNAWLADRLGLSLGSLKNLLTRLCAQGWLRRCYNGPNRTLEIVEKPVLEHHDESAARVVSGRTGHTADDHIKTGSSPPLQKTKSSSRGPETASRLSGSPASEDFSAKQNHHSARHDDKPKYPARRCPGSRGRTAVREPEPLVPARSHRRDRPAPVAEDVTVADRHRALAEKIKAFVRRQGDTVSSGYKNWSKALAVLEKTLAPQGVNFADIEEMWDWHERNWMKGGYRWPTVLNARQFAQRYADIRHKRRRIADGGRSLAPQRELTAAARRVMDGLSNLQWPASAEGSVGNSVQQSLDNLKDFFGRLDSLKDPPRDLRTARDVLRSKMDGGGEWYVTEWFSNLWKSAGAWERGPTDLTKFAWSENNGYFVTQAAKWMESEFGDGGLYRRLLAALDRQPQPRKEEK